MKKTLYGVRKYFVSIVRSRCLGIFCIGEYDEVVKQMGEFDTQTAELLESYHIDPMEGSGDEYVDEDIMFDAVEYIYSFGLFRESFLQLC